jgi:hypothetical protein
VSIEIPYPFPERSRTVSRMLLRHPSECMIASETTVVPRDNARLPGEMTMGRLVLAFATCLALVAGVTVARQQAPVVQRPAPPGDAHGRQEQHGIRPPPVRPARTAGGRPLLLAVRPLNRAGHDLRRRPGRDGDADEQDPGLRLSPPLSCPPCPDPGRSAASGNSPPVSLSGLPVVAASTRPSAFFRRGAVGLFTSFV